MAMERRGSRPMNRDAPSDSAYTRFARAILPLCIVCVCVCGGATVLGVASCVWTDSRALARAQKTAAAAKIGMTEADALIIAKSIADRVEVHDAVAGWRRRRIVVSFQRLDSEYFVVFCLDESQRVTEVAAPAEYPDACFLRSDDPA